MNSIIDEMFSTTNPIMDDTCINMNSIIDEISLKQILSEMIHV